MNRQEKSRKTGKARGFVFGLGVALLLVLGALISSVLDLGFGLGKGKGSGTGEDAAEQESPNPIPPPTPAEEGVFRIENDTIFHGSQALSVDDFVAMARASSEKGRVVDVIFVRDTYTFGFRKDVLDALEDASVPRRVREE